MAIYEKKNKKKIDQAFNKSLQFFVDNIFLKKLIKPVVGPVRPQLIGKSPFNVPVEWTMWNFMEPYEVRSFCQEKAAKMSQVGIFRWPYWFG